MRPNDILTIDDQFMEPVLHLLRDYCRNMRPGCEGLSDERYLRLGLQRVLDGDESGRAFLQVLGDDGTPLARATWFDALQSARRLAMVQELATLSYAKFEERLQGRDWLGEFPELAERAVWAVDGHQIEHACHAAPDGKGRQVPLGLTYGLCLHSGLMRPLARFQGDGRRRHEWPVFKEVWRTWLSGERRPRLPIVVADPAYIDNLFWFLQKLHKQAVVITREKENMKPEVIAQQPFDRNDPVNLGVLADELVGYSNVYLRRIRYRDAATGEIFLFITTDTVMRPGLVALLYLLRWKIEKIYDVFKNKLFAQKAWANGETAALQQAHFIALLHNLLTLLLQRLEQTGIREQKVERRHADNPSIVPSHRLVRHTQTLTCQFIRVVRNLLGRRRPWEEALPLFKLRLEAYL